MQEAEGLGKVLGRALRSPSTEDELILDFSIQISRENSRRLWLSENSLLEGFSGRCRRCWKFSPIFRQHETLSLPRFGHLPERKMAAGESATPSGTLLDLLLRDCLSLLEALFS